MTQAPVHAHPGPLRAFTGQPSGSLVVLAPRRSPPVPAPATNTDHSITVLTSTGFRELEAADYAASVAHLRPDAAVGMADVPAQRAGKNRAPKMAHRTELWLGALLSRTAGAVPVLAPVLPVSLEVQRLYFQTLEERVAEIAGLVFYDSSMAAGGEEEGIPATLDGLLRVTVDEIRNPHRLLQAIGWGADLVTLVLPTEATDAGIALAFEFPGELEEQEQQQQQQQHQAGRRLGWDLWSEPQMATDTGPLVDGCSCYACRRHHRAYVSHLLAAKEMTAWVLLQIHNVHVIDRFLTGARLSIGRGTFERDVVRFAQQYEAEMPAKTGEGPRSVFSKPVDVWVLTGEDYAVTSSGRRRDRRGIRRRLEGLEATSRRSWARRLVDSNPRTGVCRLNGSVFSLSLSMFP